MVGVVAIIVAPAAALLGARLAQLSSERIAKTHEQGEAERQHQRLVLEREARQLEALRAKRRDDATALHRWIKRLQAGLDSQYLTLSQTVAPNPLTAQHALNLISRPLPDPADAGLDVVLAPISSRALRREMRRIDKWGRDVQGKLPAIHQWLQAHPFPWNDGTQKEWWLVCQPFLDATEDRDDRFVELAQLLEMYELGLDVDDQ